MPDKSKQKSKGKSAGGGFLTNLPALITAFAALITACGGFIQIVRPGGLGLDFEDATPEPGASATPTARPSGPATATPTATPTATARTASPTPASQLCETRTLANVSVTVTSFDPGLGDSRLSIGDKVLRFGLSTARTVRVGVSITNKTSASLTLTQQNWRLFDGTSYPFASPAPTPPAYTNQSIAAARTYDGFVTFTNVPRDVSTLQLEARFGGQSTTFRLPTAPQGCLLPFPFPSAFR